VRWARERRQARIHCHELSCSGTVDRPKIGTYFRINPVVPRHVLAAFNLDGALIYLRLAVPILCKMAPRRISAQTKKARQGWNELCRLGDFLKGLAGRLRCLRGEVESVIQGPDARALQDNLAI
jgi:hypothetical protein